METLPPGKLVRDNIPDIIEADTGVRPEIIVVTGPTYYWELVKKLHEECMEVQAATTREAIVEELADVHEVLRTDPQLKLTKEQRNLTQDIARRNHITPAEIEAARGEKYQKRGGFEKGYYLVAS